jgi:hypothetical protein
MTYAHLVDRQKALTRRLDDGWDRMNQAIANGADVRPWEDFWISLLREYEHVCDEISDLLGLRR